MPKIPHVVGWVLIAAAVGAYLYEANLPAGTADALQPINNLVQSLPGLTNASVDLPLFIAGAAVLVLG